MNRLRLTVSPNVYEMVLQTEDGAVLPTDKVEITADIHEGVFVVARFPAQHVDLSREPDPDYVKLAKGIPPEEVVNQHRYHEDPVYHAIVYRIMHGKPE